MDADLDLLLTAVYVTADDLLPETAGERQAKRHRRGGRRRLRRPGDHGDTVRPTLPEGRLQASAPPVPEDSRPVRLPQAPPPAGGHPRVADGGLRRLKPRFLRRSAACRFHPGRVRQKPRDGQALGVGEMPPATGIAPATRWFFGAFGCTRSSPPTEPPEQSHWLPPNAMSATSPLSCWARTRRQRTVTLIGDKGYAGREFADRIGEMGAAIMTAQAQGRARSRPTPRADPVSASSRSSGPARTS